MTSISQNPSAAGQLARYSIDERVHDAEARARARAARRRRRSLPQPDTCDLPVGAFRFLHPVH